MSKSKSKSKSKLYYDRQSVCQSVRHPSWTRDQFFFLFETFFRQLRVCNFVAPSLTWGRVCNLLLLLVLSSAVPLGSESRGTQDHTLLSQSLRLPPTWRARSPYLYPQEQGGPDIIPGTGLPFCRLLRLAGLRWRYSIPPPHWNNPCLTNYSYIIIWHHSMSIRASRNICYKDCDKTRTGPKLRQTSRWKIILQMLPTKQFDENQCVVMDGE
jgi:hypothetical protein